MNSLISRLMPVLPKGDPEPDPRTDQLRWIGWVRRNYPCTLKQAVEALPIRREEWKRMEELTS